MEFYYHGTDQDVLILSADGGLDATSAEPFVAELEQLIQSGARKLIVDCGRLVYISSYGVAILVRLHNKLARRGGNVKLACVDSRLVRLIQVTGLSRVFEIYENLDAARAAFRN